MAAKDVVTDHVLLVVEAAVVEICSHLTEVLQDVAAVKEVDLLQKETNMKSKQTESTKTRFSLETCRIMSNGTN